MIEALILATAAGLTIPLGGMLALATGRDATPTGRWGHGIVAFGGGALVYAIALVLVPEGLRWVAPLPAVVAFVAGGAAFAALDAWLARSKGQHGQLVAMLSDFIPESAALGALMAAGHNGGPLLAGLIALQNLPESYNAFGEARSGGLRARRLLAIFGAMALLGPFAAGFGHAVLIGWGKTLGVIMLFAAGGILYLVFEDIAPAAPARGSALPPLGAVGGFALGLAGHLALGGTNG